MFLCSQRLDWSLAVAIGQVEGEAVQKREEWMCWCTHSSWGTSGGAAYSYRKGGGWVGVGVGGVFGGVGGLYGSDIMIIIIMWRTGRKTGR